MNSKPILHIDDSCADGYWVERPETRSITISHDDAAWLKQELGYQRSSDQSRLRYAHPSSIAQLHQNIERQSRILDALTGDGT